MTSETPSIKRNRELHPLAERGIRYVERRTIARSDADRSDHAGQKRPDYGSRQRAVGQRGDPETGASNHSPGNDQQVIEQRPEGGKQKQPVREQNGGDNSSDVKEDLRRQQNAGQMDGQVHLRGGKAVKHPAHKLRREDFSNDRPHDHYCAHDRNNYGEGLLRVGIALFRQEPRIDGDECNRRSAPGHDVVEPVRQGEGGDVGVGLRAGAEGVGDVSLANVADHARQHHRRHQQQCGRERRVLVRGAEEPQKSGHGLQV